MVYTVPNVSKRYSPNENYVRDEPNVFLAAPFASKKWGDRICFLVIRTLSSEMIGLGH